MLYKIFYIKNKKINIKCHKNLMEINRLKFYEII